VIACNNDGVWNRTGASVDFSIQPAFYQTSAFKILCALAGGVMLWMLCRFRIRRMQRRLGLQFEAQVRERARISREMHDSLLQEFCGFAMELDGLSKESIVPASVRESLRELRLQAQRCARETREFVWDLRAPILQEVDLSTALRAAGERITHGESVNFHVSVQGHPRPAPEKLQMQLLRIVQEATRNAVRYSRAKEIAMEISYLDSDRIRVQMRDDGCGFDMEQAAHQSGHYGLRTMRERAEELGGELKILTAPGHGTSIEVVVPIASAA
jgi:signal transduction histidine kinase